MEKSFKNDNNFYRFMEHQAVRAVSPMHKSRTSTNIGADRAASNPDLFNL